MRTAIDIGYDCSEETTKSISTAYQNVPVVVARRSSRNTRREEELVNRTCEGRQWPQWIIWVPCSSSCAFSVSSPVVLSFL